MEHEPLLGHGRPQTGHLAQDRFQHDLELDPRQGAPQELSSAAQATTPSAEPKSSGCRLAVDSMQITPSPARIV
ncbi:hypothetical protein [Streptomyces sp. NPDC056883]|uniref:hypothetical protein n=1 Tax=Streptomyces sp. NPDC056883 TaxID=3345959 RepID=UPI003695BD0E